MSELKTCFKRVDYDLAGLLHYIDIGDIGLPDIQRPFVWSNSKVRDLFDSMYRGFPVGYLLFWANQAVQGVKQIGTADKQHHVPSLLIVDGQQRLTSLYAVFRGQKVFERRLGQNTRSPHPIEALDPGIQNLARARRQHLVGPGTLLLLGVDVLTPSAEFARAATMAGASEDEIASPLEQVVQIPAVRTNVRPLHGFHASPR